MKLLAEHHLGRFTLLLATDLPVAFALVDKNDQDHMWRFLSRYDQQPNDRGEFLLENLVPGVWFSVSLDPRGLEVPLFVAPLKPGEVRDVGAIVLKNQKP